MGKGQIYPRALRERVVAAVQSGMSRRAAAARFEVAISTAINWCAQYQAVGHLEPRPRGKRKRLLEGYDDWIRARFEAVPHLTVLKLHQAFADQGVHVSHDTVWRSVRRLGLSFKKKPVRS